MDRLRKKDENKTLMAFIQYLTQTYPFVVRFALSNAGAQDEQDPLVLAFSLQCELCASRKARTKGFLLLGMLDRS